MDTAERIAELEKAEREAWRLCSAAADITLRLQADHAQAEIALAEARGDTDRARWLRLSADPDADPAEERRAYIRVQAGHALRSPTALDIMPEPDRSEVAAMVEVLRAQTGEVTP